METLARASDWTGTTTDGGRMTQEKHCTYRATHKAIRHLLFSASLQVGITDFADDGVIAETLESIDALIFVLWEHRAREDASVHLPLESRAPGVTALFAEDHEEDEAMSAEVGELVPQIRSAIGDQRVALGIRLHEQLNAYIGIYLGHLYREETELQQALWDNFTEEELLAMSRELVATIPPDRSGYLLKVMCSSCGPDDIAPILGRIKANAPPEIAQRTLQMAAENLPPSIWAKVQSRIG
jgi:hypothetical protein